MNQEILGDCLEIMPTLSDKSIDLILCDLPYGSTACHWDSIIPFEPLWKQYRRLIKDNGAIALTASQPFTSALVMSNIKMFKYELIWQKTNPSNIALANKQPMKYHENICIFYNSQPIYNKQMIQRTDDTMRKAKAKGYVFHNSGSEQTGLKKIEVHSDRYDADLKNPSSIIPINSLRPNSAEFVKHPTQKPVALFEYLIRTYTNEGDTVLDNCAGSFTTAIACLNTNRKYICIEKDEKYFEIGKKRIAEWLDKKSSELF